MPREDRNPRRCSVSIIRIYFPQKNGMLFYFGRDVTPCQHGKGMWLR